MEDNYQTPFFVAAPEENPAGVDYLGLRAINLEMMERVFPGINNVVSKVRLFSLMAWIAWKFGEGIEGANGDLIASKYKTFREKVETLFVWSHVENDAAQGLPGNQQKDSGAAILDFTFAAFDRQVSLQDAALYGPALKHPNGLWFLDTKNGQFVARAEGKALASGLDERLRLKLTAAQYSFVTSIERTRFPRNELDGFWEAWNVETPSTVEQQAFARTFYQPHTIGTAFAHATRSCMLFLTIEYLRAAKKPLSAEELRKHIATANPPPAVRDHPRQEVLFVRKRWQLLQVRQAQRLGLEALFGWLERCLQLPDSNSISKLVQLTVASFKRDQKNSEVSDSWVRQGLDFYGKDAADVDALFAIGLKDPRRDLFAAISGLRSAVEDLSSTAPIPLAAFSLLLQCAVFADAFRREPFTAKRVDAGLKTRVPLGAWGHFVTAYKDQPVADFVRKVIETFLVSQHLGTAAMRTRDGRSRMRLSIEDKGLTSLLASPGQVLRPAPSQDRLPSSLEMLTSCGLISKNSDGRYFV